MIVVMFRIFLVINIFLLGYYSGKNDAANQYAKLMQNEIIEEEKE